MAFTHGKNAKVYANGYDLSAWLRKVNTSGEADTAETSTFQRNSKTKVAGQKSGKLTAEGLFSHSNAAGSQEIDDVLQAALGVENVCWIYGPEGDAAGKRATLLAAITNSYEIESPVDDVVSVKAEAESSGTAVEGGIFLVSGAQAATGNGADQDNGALTSNGALLMLQAVDVTGAAPSLTVKVQHSVDGSAWVDLTTFTAVAADNKAEFKEVTGTVNRHLRAIWTFGGTMTGAVFAVAAARR